MKRPFAIVFCVLAAAGCARWTDIDSDAFDQGRASQERFTLDGRDCGAIAEHARSFGVIGISQDAVGKRRIYNRTFAACMKAKGYRQRDSLPDLTEVFDF